MVSAAAELKRRRDEELDDRLDLIGVMSEGLAEDVAEYLARISLGSGRLTAALSVSWSPWKLDQLSKDPSFRELEAYASEMKLESVEEMIYERARHGNMTAAQLVVYSHAGHRGWRPPAQRVAVTTTGKFTVESVASARQAIIETIESTPAKDLQLGGPLDQIGPGDRGSSVNPAT